MKAINQKRVAINVSIKFWLITFYQRRFRCNLNLSFSFKKIVKPPKLASWPFSVMRSKIADFLGFFTRFPGVGVIPRCSETLVSELEVSLWKEVSFWLSTIRNINHSSQFSPKAYQFSPNAGKYEAEKTPHLDTFHAVQGCL